ncbi:MAG: hypothetical protein KJP26_11765, partial [Maribacter sp.]|nr:hypothetical protein [Maribacter sp.]
MKRSILASMLAVATIFSVSAQNEVENTLPEFEIKVITSIESIVPLGLGRSRIISANTDRDYEE